jgi:hypothetical protein
MVWRRHGLGAMVGLVGAFVPWCAQAQTTAPVALIYEHAPQDTACRDEAWLRQALAGRLGHDPFESDAPESLSLAAAGVRRVRVAVLNDGATRRLRVTFEDAAGAALTVREPPLRLDPSRCAELARLAVNLVVTRVVELPPPPPPPAPPPPPPPPPPPRERIEIAILRDRPPPPARIRWGVSFLIGAVAGVTPTVTPTLRAGVSLSGTHWRAALEVQGDLAVADAVWLDQSWRADRVLGTALGCWRHAWFVACGLVRGGALHAATTPQATYSGWIVQFEAGARLAAEWAIGDRVALVGQLEGILPIERRGVEFGPTEQSAQVVWSPQWGAGAALGVAVGF